MDVDDLTMAGSLKQAILHFKDGLWETLCIRDLGELHWIMGIEVKRDCVRCKDTRMVLPAGHEISIYPT